MWRFSMTFLGVALLLLASSFSTVAQTSSGERPEMQAVESAIARGPAIAGKAQWKCVAVKPIEGTGKNVSIDQWTADTDEGVVTITLQVEASPMEAAKALRQFASHVQGTATQNVADEAYTWGRRGAIALRRGAILAYISAVATADPTNRDAEASLSRQFAEAADGGLLTMAVKRTP